MVQHSPASSEQAKRITTRAHEIDIDVSISADIAPDLLVPWRHPMLTVNYTNAALDLGGAGFVPAPPWPRVVDGLPLTDPVQQWCDLLDLGGEARQEAADRLRAAIVGRTLARWPHRASCSEPC